jgi:hypothetical protein
LIVWRNPQKLRHDETSGDSIAAVRIQSRGTERVGLLR